MPAPTLVLVEGESDAEALAAVVRLLGRDLDPALVHLQPAHGVTGFSRLFSEFRAAHPGGRYLGMYDAGEERFVRRALADAAVAVDAGESLESHGFFACVADLEDELIRALGVDAVLRVVESEGELASFRRFQGMPQHRQKPVDQQLRRFLGTRATRKIRAARRLVEALDPARLPRPLQQLMAAIFEASGSAP